MPASLYNPVFQLFQLWPNVLIGREDDDVKLIDFDWGGKEAGKEEDVNGVGVRYPAHLSEAPIWTERIGPMECIRKSHDLAMHRQWFSHDSPPA